MCDIKLNPIQQSVYYPNKFINKYSHVKEVTVLLHNIIYILYLYNIRLNSIRSKHEKSTKKVSSRKENLL